MPLLLAHTEALRLGEPVADNDAHCVAVEQALTVMVALRDAVAHKLSVDDGETELVTVGD